MGSGLLKVTQKGMLKTQLTLNWCPASLISTWVDALLAPTAAAPLPHLSQLSLTLSFFPFYLPEFCPKNFAGYLVSSSEIPSQSRCSINLPVSVPLPLLIFCHQLMGIIRWNRKEEKKNPTNILLTRHFKLKSTEFLKITLLTNKCL